MRWACRCVKPTEGSMQRILGMGMVLVLALSLAAAGNDQKKPATPAEQFQALAKECQEAKAASSSARLSQVALRSLELAEKHPKDPVAVDALILVVRVYNSSHPPAGQVSPAPKALVLLQRDHAGSDKVGEVCRRISFGFGREYEA